MDLDTDPRYGRAPPRHYYGKYAGTVSDNGPPSSGDHRGQVKVKVSGLLEETADGSDNQPLEVLARPAFHPGFFFVPDNGANVWVEFVAGDINYPIWTGVWYPDGATPKTTDPSDPSQQGGAPTLDQKVIRTTSGHVIELDDTSGSEALIVKDETHKNMITFDQSGITFVDGTHQNTIKFDSNGIKLTDNNNNSIVFNSTGITMTDNNNNSIAFSSSGIVIGAGATPPTATLTLANNTITLTANQTITLTAGSSPGTSVTIDASSGTQMKATGVTVTINKTMDVSAS